MQNAKKLAIVSQGLYYYRINNVSITETYRRAENEKIAERGISISEVFKNIAEQVPSEYENLKKYLISRAVNAMHGALFRIYSHKLTKDNTEFVKTAKSYIRKNWRTVCDDKSTYGVIARASVLIFKFAYPLWYMTTKF